MMILRIATKLSAVGFTQIASR